jgi:3-hydroxyisobutyrate dehydrogenase-like beta-hydroxyacid dehydrogenase
LFHCVSCWAFQRRPGRNPTGRSSGKQPSRLGALSNSYKDIRQALEVAAELQIPMPLLSMANQIQEMGRASGLTRLNGPAAMGKLYELITGTDLSGATMKADKKLPDSREPRVVYLED